MSRLMFLKIMISGHMLLLKHLIFSYEICAFISFLLSLNNSLFFPSGISLVTSSLRFSYALKKLIFQIFASIKISYKQSLERYCHMFGGRKKLILHERKFVKGIQIYT